MERTGPADSPDRLLLVHDLDLVGAADGDLGPVAAALHLALDLYRLALEMSGRVVDFGFLEPLERVLLSQVAQIWRRRSQLAISSGEAEQEQLAGCGV
jgi:hypothetical protein